jgi:hypothetical protein
MTLTRKLALALCLAFSFITPSSNAQVDSTTGNLINYGTTPTDTTSKWNNGVYVNQLGCFGGNTPGNCGPYPNVQTNGSINFSYGQVDLNQIININRALAAGGSGVQLNGFNFGFTAKNGNGWDDGRQDYLSAYVKFYNAGGGLAANYDYTSQTNRKYNWTNFNFSETFSSPVAASQFSNAQVGFVGRDNNYWAGPYGPEIQNVSFSLKYRVDPCSTNPAYSPSCTGFKDVITSNNILPQPDAWGQAMVQMAAVNVALQNGGIGAQVHGIKYSFDWAVGDSQCTSSFLFWCTGWTDSNINVNVRMNSANNTLLLNRNYGFSGQNVSGHVEDKYLLPASLNQTALGSVGMASSGWGDAQAGNFRASLIYTPDPCVSNPLYSTQCSGYAVAYAKNMLLGSTVASASGAIVSSTGSTSTTGSMSSPTGTVDQTNPQPEQQAQQTQQQSSPMQDANQNTAVAQADPAQPSPTQAGPAPTSPQPAGGPAQTTTASGSSQQAGPGAGGGGGPSKLAMSVLKTAQANDKATQAAAVQNAAKAFEGAVQSSQASSNLAISLNQDMSANSAVAAAAFSNQTTQASQQTAAQATQQQQTTQTGSTIQQTARMSQQEQKQQQEVQLTEAQSTSSVQAQAPQQQETQQAQVQSSTSIVKLLAPQPQEDAQQTQGQGSTVVQYQAPKQQETTQAQAQSSTSVVKLLPPATQESQQTQSQTTVGMMLPAANTYTPPQIQQQDLQSAQITVLKPPAQPVIELPQQASSGNGLTVNRNLFAYNPQVTSNNSMSSVTQQPQTIYQTKFGTPQTEVDVPQTTVASFAGTGRAGNPLSEIMMQQRFEMMQNNIAAPASSVNKNVLPNELAGGVDIAAMASVPTGFSAYSIVLKDAAFYEIKEVYKNQKTVDNERVLRGLTRGSDARHQEMVNSQYKLGE